jgi:hypothetical protein
MTELLLHSRPVKTVFDLLGDKEDDITYSFGWALAQSDRLVRALLSRAFKVDETDTGDLTALLLQETVPGAGRTDVEVQTDGLHLIVEAKRGWALPTIEQLAQYTGRFDAARVPRLLVVSECSTEYATPRLPVEVAGVPVSYLPWGDVATLVEDVAGVRGAGQAERRLLREFVRYLRGLMTMQDPTSNLVYVVALGTADLFGSGVSFADIVVEHDRYFHPLGGGYLKTPPNYFGFRFHGRLQQIRHVEDYDVVMAPWDAIPGLAGKTDWGHAQHFLYTLGPPIVPTNTVRTGGPIRNMRLWAALDLLLTSETILEARDKTNERLAKAGA